MLLTLVSFATPCEMKKKTRSAWTSTLQAEQIMI